MSKELKCVGLFTIVVCTYNGENFLPRCLDALIHLEQLHENVEKIFVVDNNSTDGTKRIINEFCNKDTLFEYVFEKRQGLSYAREQAVKATTDWVIYVDDDNILDSKWLIKLKEIVGNNPTVGVVNGAVIATPDEELNSEQKAILKAIYRNLACTHCTEPKSNDMPNTIPMGAGMCIKTDALKNIEKDGWLNLKGRIGNKLSSGEDTELCERVFIQGYSYISDYKMKLYHIIPISRLEEDYIKRLIEGLVSGRVEFIKSKRAGTLKCWLRKIKYFCRLIIERKKLKNVQDDVEAYWRTKVAVYQAEAFIRLI